MRVSLNMVKEFLGESVDLGSVDDVVRKIGAQLGAVEEVTEMSPRYKDVVVSRVASCEKHPNADKLSVCWIDDGGVSNGIERGDNGLVQVVCGAPNVREGMLVAWIPPGATVPVTYDKDPFVLGARELRGVMSNGMLASGSELGINDDHSGLLEISNEENAQPGTPFSRLYGCDDVLIDIENKMFTHRPDCFGVLGVAREIAGIYNVPFDFIEWYWKMPRFAFKDYEFKPEVEPLELQVENQLQDLCPRFMVVAMSNVEIAPSPLWMQALLTRVGIKPINNVVDMTNYLSYVTAQPLHIYDYDKVANLSEGVPKLIVRKPQPKEAVALLNGKTIEPRPEAVMIATDKELVGFGGVMGGTSTEVDQTTNKIIIECANFDMYNIRRTSMEHGLFTEAVTRFTKGQSPLQCDRVISKAIEMVGELAGGKQASKVIDEDHFGTPHDDQVFHANVRVNVNFINSRLGLQLTDEEICGLLRNVNFACVPHGSGEYEIAAPFWRTDIELPEDIVEEVGRLLGFEKVPIELPKRSTSPAQIDKMLTAKKYIRGRLASMGANEVLTHSFIHADIMKKAGQDVEQSFKITNALSPELQQYRMSLTPNLLQLVHPNIKAGHNAFALYEIGKVHGKSEIDENGVPKEFGRVGLIVADKFRTGAAFFLAKAYVNQLTYGKAEYRSLDSSAFKDHQLFQQLIAPFEPGRSAFVFVDDNKLVGVVGEYKLNVMRSFKLPEFTAGFELFTSSLSSIRPNEYVPLSMFPAIFQDVCLEIDENTAYSELERNFKNVLLESSGGNQIQVELIDIYSSDKIAGKKRITFRIKMCSYERTLQEEQVTEILQQSVERLANQVNVVRI